ncbi:MAG: DUF1365 domain-containing protein [Actinomycetia bacterium]|nr:DUF1365 domain-containing protein [Actinomycetes bacterium]
MNAGLPALCEGSVVHRRSSPEHQFIYPVTQVWLDPDDPDELCALHPAWSARHPAPVRFRRRDYGADPRGSLADAARDDLASVLGYRPGGPVRMLSQLRRWGWLFNPITFFFVWDDSDEATPVGVVLEVTNTPWKERTRYPLGLGRSGTRLGSKFDKSMHVSPFLGMDHQYRLSLEDRDDRIAIDIDVLDPDDRLVLHTALRLDRRVATRSGLGRSLREDPVPTHRVSLGIHAQAARLSAKGVSFIAHPRRRKPSTPVPSRPLQEETP